jgi:DNA repair protein RecO (recombination protein O)
MLHTTRGIVLHSVKFSETSVIAKIYTEAFGLKSYMFKGVYKPRARVRANMLQHLNLLELVTDNREYRGIQNVREIRIEHPYKTIPFDVLKSTVALFINEMLYRSIRHEEKDPALFDFIRSSMIWYDDTGTKAVNFHLWFVVHLSRFLGFYPGNIDTGGTIFNLAEGKFQGDIPLHEFFIKAPASDYLRHLINCQPEAIAEMKIPHIHRAELTEQMIRFYKLHMHDFGDIKSREILTEILS